MENDVLKNKIVPWQEKGRWYHGAWDISAQNWITDETDEPLTHLSPTVSANIYYLYPTTDEFVFIDSKIIPRGKTEMSSSASAYMIRFSTTGKLGVPIAPSGTSGIVDVYIFAI